jgi:glycosyltransferase involved in cell wall biosynthesis
MSHDLITDAARRSSGVVTTKVAVCALTYKRADGIARLLQSLADQAHTNERPYELTVVVVDNDPNGSARGVVAPFAAAGLDVVYVVEPTLGIPFARNRALDTVPAGTDFVVFIDDDEWPVATWIDAMLEMQIRTGADCVYGPVEPVFPPNPPRYFIRSRVFDRKRHPDGAALGYAATNNVMVRRSFIARHGLRFEERMRFTGGTDYLFFNTAVRLGMRIVWAARALVYDTIPADRMTWAWVLRRQYRLGNTFAVSDSLGGSVARRLFRLGYGLSRIGLGVLMLPGFLVSPFWGMRSATHILRGAGMANGILGHAYQEYAPAKGNQSK